jgi:hypothetical protein
VAAEQVEIGAAIIFNNTNFEKQVDDGSHHLLISKPTTSLVTCIPQQM